MAVEAGADSLEHGYFISQPTLEVMAAKGIPWMPPCLIAVKGNPLNDLKALKNIQFMLMPRWG